METLALVLGDDCPGGHEDDRPVGRPTCPGCDGTIARAMQRGDLPTGTWEACAACAERESALFEEVEFLDRSPRALSTSEEG